ncbi:acetate--CoA ligase alpha subunit [Desulfotruncus alcoholivorax]|uniref:acetate--CoA ligase alpha subunit n=1 Tax=Desulfotruncus alcoholivorax TaxID=265477 RepID=UPI00041B8A77|nr:acetate--CoA ligase [Desulfotruncus alcoholivorax]
MTDLTGFFNPRSVAIAGASQKPGKIGNAILKNIINSGYKGAIYPVNPKAQEIEGLPCYPDIGAIQDPPELVVVAVPAAKTLDLAKTCGEKGVKHLVVITAGFKEVGRDGLELEKKLVEVCNSYQMNMLGPNCVGMMNTHASLNASFSATYPARPGDITFISQSGAMLVAILDWSSLTGLNFSKVVSLGNKAQLNEADFIDAAANDPTTKVILCYIEDVANGDYFLEVAEQATRKKPVIILKSGTSQAGAMAASSHTGALAGSDLAYETAFSQCGVIRAHSMPELFDLAVAFSEQPVPPNRNVAVVTNAGGPGIVATDTVEASGMAMARFTKDTIDALRQSLPAESNIYNPVDVLGDAGADRYHTALEKVLADPNVGSAVVLVCPTAVTDPVPTAQAIVDLHHKHPDKPVLAAYMGGPMLAPGAELLSKSGIPCFTFPEPAINAISGMSRYSAMQARPEEHPERAIHADRGTVKTIFDQVRQEGRLVLLGSEAYQAAKAYGIPAAPVLLAASPDQAVQLAEQIGFPVVLKVASPKIMHKTDVGGVLIGLKTAEEVRRGYIEITENVQRYLPDVIIHGIEIQKMMPQGTELIVGMSRDVQFGPLIAFGLGGIYVNLMKDVSFRLARGLTEKEIQKMLTETKAYTLLKGYRGEQPADIGAIVDIIARTARLVTDFSEITELDINPVFAYPEGASALDIKITVS